MEHPDWVGEAAAAGLGFVVREWEKASRQPGAWYDRDLADAMVARWPVWFRHTEGRWGGRPFVLVPWQAAIVRLLFGWKLPDGYRLYRRLLLWIGRKNGKSEFLASLSLAFFLVDAEFGGQAYTFASSESQARIVFDKAKAMVLLSPPLAAEITPQADSLYCAALRAKLLPLSGRAAGKHGLSASVISGDEIHEWRDLELYNTLHQSTSARDQPIELLASTAGIRGAGGGEQLWDESRRIEAGDVDAYDTLVAIFAAGTDDDWQDEETWRKANPNLGVSPTLRFLRDECRKANDSPRLQAAFRMYYLNQWLGSTAGWIPIDKWDAGAPDKNRWRAIADEMRGKACYGGLDISSTSDLTALVWLFPPDDSCPRWTVLPRLWVPAANVELRARRDRVAYDAWARDGAITPTDGNTIDLACIRAAVMRDAEIFDVRALAVDRLFQGHETGVILYEKGLPVAPFGQGYLSMSPASKDLERLVLAGSLDAGGHPCLRWQVGNLAFRMDDAGNIKPSKRKSVEKIDGMVALIMALGMAFRGDQPPDLDDILSRAQVI